VKIDGDEARTIKVGEPLTLVAWVTDDGVPKSRGQVGAAVRPSQAAVAANASATTPRINPLLVPPSRVTVGKRVGLHLSWFVYRAAVPDATSGTQPKARFDPAQIKVWEETRTGANSPWAPLWTPPTLPPDGRHETRVTFDTPGTYVLRARADDGALYDDQNLTVTVVR
jgi:hypothetical protein